MLMEIQVSREFYCFVYEIDITFEILLGNLFSL